MEGPGRDDVVAARTTVVVSAADEAVRAAPSCRQVTVSDGGHEAEVVGVERRRRWVGLARPLGERTPRCDG